MAGIASIAIVGHSFVAGLESLVTRDAACTPALGLTGCRATWLGVRGGRVGNSAMIRSWGETLPAARPEVVIMLIGDNDIASDAQVEDADELASQLVAMASLLRAKSRAQAVYICQLMPRFPSGFSNPRHPFNPQYNEIARTVNEAVERQVRTVPGLRFWAHRFVASPSANARRANALQRRFVAKDGVHLNKKGLVVLYKSLRDLLTGHRRR